MRGVLSWWVLINPALCLLCIVVCPTRHPHHFLQRLNLAQQFQFQQSQPMFLPIIQAAEGAALKVRMALTSFPSGALGVLHQCLPWHLPPSLQQIWLGSTVTEMLPAECKYCLLKLCPVGSDQAHTGWCWNDLFSLFSSWWALCTPVTWLVFLQKKKTAVSIYQQIPWQRF